MFASRPPEPPPPTPGAMKGKAPPKCPKCEVTKTEYARILENYQRTYRKKIDTMRMELTETRSSSKRLQQQVNSLKSWTRFQMPSIVVGMALGYIGNLLFQKHRAKKVSDKKTGEKKEDQE